MNVRDMMRNTPGWVIAVCATIGFVTVIGAFVFLAATGADATDFRAFLNTVLNVASVVLGGGAFLAAGSAAKSAANAETQTNGALDKRIATQVAGQLISHGLTKTEVTDDGRPTV